MRRFIDRLFASPRMGTAAAVAAGLGALGLSLGALALASALQDADAEQRAAVTAYAPVATTGTRP